MATEAIELYRCEIHGWQKYFRFVLTPEREGLQLCPLCGRELKVVDLDEAKELLRRQEDSE